MFFRKKKKPPPAPPQGPAVVGLYGKHLSAGDFLKLNASGPEVQLLDQWLAGAMSTGPRLLSNWDKDYPTFFAASFLFTFYPDGAAPRSVLGVMAPSHDKGGRDFPLVVFASVAASLGEKYFAALPHDEFIQEATRLLQRRNAMRHRDQLFREVERLRAPDEASLEQARQEHEKHLAETSWIATAATMFGLSAPMQQGNALGAAATIVDGLRDGVPLPRYGIRCPLGQMTAGNAGFWLELFGSQLPQQTVPNAIWTPNMMMVYLRKTSAKALAALLDPKWQDDSIFDLGTVTTGQQRARLPQTDLSVGQVLALHRDPPQ